MDDETRLALCKSILDQHFGLYQDGVSKCATCNDVAWPCPPARLARQTQDEVLAR